MLISAPLSFTSTVLMTVSRLELLEQALDLPAISAATPSDLTPTSA